MDIWDVHIYKLGKLVLHCRRSTKSLFDSLIVHVLNKSQKNEIYFTWISGSSKHTQNILIFNDS